MCYCCLSNAARVVQSIGRQHIASHSLRPTRCLATRCRHMASAARPCAVYKNAARVSPPDTRVDGSSCCGGARSGVGTWRRPRAPYTERTHC